MGFSARQKMPNSEALFVCFLKTSYASTGLPAPHLTFLVLLLAEARKTQEANQAGQQ